MPALLLHTFGILKHAASRPASQAFMATSPGVIESIPGTPGLLKHSIITFMPDGTSMSEETEFGIPPTPTFFEKDIDRYGLATLSAWDDAESAVGFSFHRIHGDALKHRKDWFLQDHTWPSSVMWWTDDIDSVDWVEADSRLVRLNEHGPARDGFTFQSLFSAEGESMKLDQDRVQELRLG